MVAGGAGDQRVINLREQDEILQRMMMPPLADFLRLYHKVQTVCSLVVILQHKKGTRENSLFVQRINFNVLQIAVYHKF